MYLLCILEDKSKDRIQQQNLFIPSDGTDPFTINELITCLDFTAISSSCFIIFYLYISVFYNVDLSFFFPKLQ